MPSTRRQKAKARRSREMDMLSDYDNLDVMLGSENNNPIERELAEAIDQSSAHGDDDTNVYHENEFRDYLHENEPLRQNEVRQSFEAFSSEFILRLSQEMESMVSIMHSQINRAITTAIAERVIPEIQNIANSMSSMGHRDTEASSSPNSQENRESAPGPKIKIAKKDSRSVGDLRDTMCHGSYSKSAYKAYKICQFGGLKKRKVTAIVCVFYEKRRLNLAGKRPSWRNISGSKLAKGLQSVKVFLLQYRKNRKVGSIWRARGDALRFFFPSVASHQKSLTMPEKLEGGTV